MLRPRHEHTSGSGECWRGTIKNHDQVLIVMRLEPTKVGSNLYELTELETHVFEEDVRRVVKLKEIEQRVSKKSENSKRIRRFTIEQQEKHLNDEACAHVDL